MRRKVFWNVVGMVMALWAATFVVGNVCGCLPALSAAELVARKVSCALANRNLSDLDILAKCAVDPKDAKNVLDIVGQEREHDARLMRIGCGGDAGTP
jgi:hypothetical protein